MTTAISLLNDARYDLKDYGTGVNIGNTEMTNYLNRVVRIFGRELCNRDADYTHASTSTSCSSAANYIAAPTRVHSIRSVWIGSDRIEEISPRLMDYKRKFYSGSAKPSFWTHRGANIEFQQTPGLDASSSQYVCNVHYRELPADITSVSSSSTPWGGIYDDAIRDNLVFYCRAKKDDTMENPDQAVAGQTKRTIDALTIARKKHGKPYRLDF
jgi:hypothetical protein